MAKASSYHHGDLFAEMLEAAERVLRRDGIAGLGIRAIAREVGVSHTAAQHHFGDLAGLLAELAAVGYRRLAAGLEAAVGESRRARQIARGRAYVDFARDNPGLFALMFRTELVDMRRPSLAQAAGAAMRGLLDGPSSGPPKRDPPTDLPREAAIRATAAWAIVHGLASLLVDKRLRGLVKLTSAFDDADALVGAVLETVTLSLETP